MIEPKQITVSFELGEPQAVTVRPLKVSQFPSAFQAFDAEDELRLVELSTGMHAGWAATVSVDSYGELVNAMLEVNGTGFFAYAGRRMMFRSTKAAQENPRSASNGRNTSPTSARGLV
jgi:hypothetical protein